MKNQPLNRRLCFALNGVAAALKNEKSFRLQSLATVGVLALLMWLKPTPVWWALLLMNCGMVLAAEMINTALEHTLDHLIPEHHPAVEIAKDTAAAAVLILSVTAVCVLAAFLLSLTFVMKH